MANLSPVQVRRLPQHFLRSQAGRFRQLQAPLRDYLAAIFLFTNGAKGVSALQMGRDLDVSYKTAFVLCRQAARGHGDGRADDA